MELGQYSNRRGRPSEELDESGIMLASSDARLRYLAAVELTRPQEPRLVKRILLNMSSPIKLACLMLLLAAGCFAQNEIVVENKQNQKWPTAEASKIYASSCAVVQQEFGGNQTPKPQLTLILGADKNSVSFDRREVSLTKWNPYLFAEGVVMLASEGRLSYEQRMLLTKRAVSWAESTVDISGMKK